MNPSSLPEAKKLFASIKSGVSKMSLHKNIHIVICPPHPFLQALTPTRNIVLGAQNSFGEREGPYTGATSPLMLKSVGAQYVILGHSERREYFGEDDEMVNKKVKVALASRLRPVLAIGEKVRNSFDRRGRYTNELDPMVGEQLTQALKKVSPAQIKNMIITYEPVWAISKGDPKHITATPDDVLTATLFIRKTLSRIYSRSLAQRIPVIYGGSTNSRNIANFLQEGGADGALVGSASLKAGEFLKMIETANKIVKEGK